MTEVEKPEEKQEEKKEESTRPRTIKVRKAWGHPRSGKMLVRHMATNEIRMIPAEYIGDGEEFSIDKKVFDNGELPKYRRS